MQPTIADVQAIALAIGEIQWFLIRTLSVFLCLEAFIIMYGAIICRAVLLLVAFILILLILILFVFVVPANLGLRR